MDFSIFENSKITFCTSKDVEGPSESRNDISHVLINNQEQQTSATSQITSFQDKGELYKQESQQMKKDLVDLRKGNIVLQDSQKELQAELKLGLMEEILNLDELLQSIKRECRDETLQMDREFGQLKNEYKTMKYDYLIANNIYEELKKQDDIKKSVYC